MASDLIAYIAELNPDLSGVVKEGSFNPYGNGQPTYYYKKLNLSLASQVNQVIYTATGDEVLDNITMTVTAYDDVREILVVGLQYVADGDSPIANPVDTTTTDGFHLLTTYATGSVDGAGDGQLVLRSPRRMLMELDDTLVLSLTWDSTGSISNLAILVSYEVSDPLPTFKKELRQRALPSNRTQIMPSEDRGFEIIRSRQYFFAPGTSAFQEDNQLYINFGPEDRWLNYASLIVEIQTPTDSQNDSIQIAAAIQIVRAGDTTLSVGLAASGPITKTGEWLCLFQSLQPGIRKYNIENRAAYKLEAGDSIWFSHESNNPNGDSTLNIITALDYIYPDQPDYQSTVLRDVNIDMGQTTTLEVTTENIGTATDVNVVGMSVIDNPLWVTGIQQEGAPIIYPHPSPVEDLPTEARPGDPKAPKPGSYNAYGNQQMALFFNEAGDELVITAEQIESEASTLINNITRRKEDKKILREIQQQTEVYESTASENTFYLLGVDTALMKALCGISERAMNWTDTAIHGDTPYIPLDRSVISKQTEMTEEDVPPHRATDTPEDKRGRQGRGAKGKGKAEEWGKEEIEARKGRVKANEDKREAINNKPKNVRNREREQMSCAVRRISRKLRTWGQVMDWIWGGDKPRDPAFCAALVSELIMGPSKMGVKSLEAHIVIQSISGCDHLTVVEGFAKFSGELREIIESQEFQDWAQGQWIDEERDTGLGKLCGDGHAMYEQAKRGRMMHALVGNRQDLDNAWAVVIPSAGGKSTLARSNARILDIDDIPLDREKFKTLRRRALIDPSVWEIHNTLMWDIHRQWVLEHLGEYDYYLLHSVDQAKRIGFQNIKVMIPDHDTLDRNRKARGLDGKELELSKSNVSAIYREASKYGLPVTLYNRDTLERKVLELPTSPDGYGEVLAATRNRAMHALNGNWDFPGKMGDIQSLPTMASAAGGSIERKTIPVVGMHTRFTGLAGQQGIQTSDVSRESTMRGKSASAGNVLSNFNDVSPPESWLYPAHYRDAAGQQYQNLNRPQIYGVGHTIRTATGQLTLSEIGGVLEKILMKQSNIRAFQVAQNGFRTPDLAALLRTQGDDIGDSMVTLYVKLWGYMLALTTSFGGRVLPFSGQVGIFGGNTITDDPPVVQLGYNTAGQWGANCGGATSVFPYDEHPNPRVYFHVQLSTVPAGEPFFFVPPSLLLGNDSGYDTITLAMLVMALGPYPAGVYRVDVDTTDSAGANGAAQQFVHNASLWHIGGYDIIHFILPMKPGAVPPARNQAEADANALVIPSSGPTASNGIPADNLLFINFDGGGLAGYDMAEYLYTWLALPNSPIDTLSISTFVGSLASLTSRTQDVEFAWELACLLTVRYPVLYQQTPGGGGVFRPAEGGVLDMEVQNFFALRPELMPQDYPYESKSHDFYLPSMDYIWWSKIMSGVFLPSPDHGPAKPLQFSWSGSPRAMLYAMYVARTYAAVAEMIFTTTGVPQEVWGNAFAQTGYVKLTEFLRKFFCRSGTISTLQQIVSPLGKGIAGLHSSLLGWGPAHDMFDNTIWSYINAPREGFQTAWSQAGAPLVDIPPTMLPDIWLWMTLQKNFKGTTPLLPPWKKMCGLRIEGGQTVPLAGAGDWSVPMKNAHTGRVIGYDKIPRVSDEELFNQRLVAQAFLAELYTLDGNVYLGAYPAAGDVVAQKAGYVDPSTPNLVAPGTLTANTRWIPFMSADGRRVTLGVTAVNGGAAMTRFMADLQYFAVETWLLGTTNIMPNAIVDGVGEDGDGWLTSETEPIDPIQVSEAAKDSSRVVEGTTLVMTEESAES
jgi:hypothetical protein